MKRRLLIIPIVMVLMLACVIPAFAAGVTTTTGVTVADSVGSPGGIVKMKIKIPSVTTDNIGIRVTYDKNALTLSEESKWLVEGTLSDVDVEAGIAAWCADATTVENDIFELAFQVNENAEVGSATQISYKICAMHNKDVKLDATGTAEITIQNVAKISGTVISYGKKTDAVKVELLNDKEQIVKEMVLEDGKNVYAFDVEQGNYVIRVSKTKHCTREYVISMMDLKDKVQDVEICLYGDVNKDGKVNAVDVRGILKYYNGKNSAITDTDTYSKNRADVTGDGKINAVDVREILKYYNGKPSKFDNLK